MKRLLSSPWARYGVALLFSVAALALTQLTVFRDASESIPFLLAILLTARLGGLGPGLFAATLAVLANDYFFIPPLYSLQIENPNDLFKLGGFALGAITVSWLAAAYRKSTQLTGLLSRRQSLIAKISESALTSQDQADLLTTVAPLLCESFNVEYAGIFQFLPDATSVVLKAGCGWSEGELGQTFTETDVEYLSGSSQLPNEPSVLDLRRSEMESQVPQLLLEHNVQSGMSILILGDARPFGFAGVYASDRRRFSEADIEFLKTFSELLSKAFARIQSTEQLRDKSSGLCRTLASIAEGLIVLDSQGVVTFINSVGQALTGFSQRDAVAQQIDSIFQGVDEKSEEPIQNPATRALRSGSVSKLESHAVLIAKNGKRISIDGSAAPILDESGKSTGAVLIFRDTTVPRRIEESIRQSEERLRVALKNSPVVVSNQDCDLRYTWVHHSMHGFPDQSVIGKTDVDLMPTVDAGRWSEVKRGVIESGIGTRVEISASIDGQRRSFDLTVEPLRNSEDMIVGVTCAAIEITERKREQAAISRLAAIVESSEDAIVGKTLDGIILSWNPGAERMYGYDPDEIIGQPVSILYPPDRLDEFRDVTERLKRSEPVKQHDTIRVRKDGKRIDVSVSISLVRDGMGRVIGASSIARDITERKQLLVENAQLLQKLEQANSDLEKRVVQRTIELQGTNEKLQAEIAERQRANEQLRQLSAHLQSAREEERTRVAREIHDELGQVLTVVKMDLSLLERNLSESGMKNPNEELATQIHATSQLVDDSIKKMREIIRELRPGILDHLGLKSAIEWQAQEFQARTNIECHLETSEEEIALDLDRSTAVFRIFQETLTNIARHSQATRVDIRLEKNDHLMLQVRDNGRGITETEISNDRSFGILGMRERALIFGGEVEVHGEPSKGTLVRVHIPLEKQHD